MSQTCTTFMSFISSLPSSSMAECPFDDSPVEIIHRIFNEIILSENASDCSTSVRLASVYRYWCSIVLDTPEMWTKIHLRNTQVASEESAKAVWNGLGRIQLAVKRSRHLPLSLTVDSITNTSLLAAVLTSQVGRLTHLNTLYSGKGWTKLAGELRHLETEVADHRLLLPSLTHWELGEDVARIALRAAPNLTHLTLRANRRLENSGRWLDVSEFPHLRHIELNVLWLAA